MRIQLPIIESFIDYPSEKGSCLTVFFTGCGFSCNGCHNTGLKKFEAEGSIDIKPIELYNLLLEESSRRRHTDKLVLQGGDPFFHKNFEGVIELLNINKFFDICIYTGYPIDFLKENNIKGFQFAKCGIYDENLKQDSFKNSFVFSLASSNQNIYDKNYNQMSENGILHFKE